MAIIDAYATTRPQDLDPWISNVIGQTSRQNDQEGASMRAWTAANQAYQQDQSDENRQRTMDAWNQLSQHYRNSFSEKQQNYGRVLNFNQAKNQADKFRHDTPDYLYSQYQPLVDQAGYGLQNSEREIMREYNRRGLLNSGQMLGRIISTRSQVASQLSSMKSQINQEARGIQSGMDTAVGNIGLNSFQDSVNQANQTYQTALNNVLQRKSALDGVFGGIGAGIGTVAGQVRGSNAASTPSTTGTGVYSPQASYSPETSLGNFQQYGSQRGF